jgi:hypothetical protein
MNVEVNHKAFEDAFGINRNSLLRYVLWSCDGRNELMRK